MNARLPDNPETDEDKLAPAALYQTVAERLRQRIFAHELAPGAWIDEQALAEQYGISRTPMREALKVLAAEGLVTLKPRRGCYVTEISEQDLDEIFPIISLLEGRCAFEATAKASEADLAQLQAIHDELERHAAAADIERYFDANQRFHRALQALAGNRWLQQVIEDMRKVLRLTRQHSLLVEGRLEASLAEHRGILAAVRARDAGLAEERMRAHLMMGRRAVGKPVVPRT